MTNGNDAKLKFSEWLPVYEREQELHSKQIGELIQVTGSLAKSLSRTEANVETLLKNQGRVAARLDRPWQWGAVVSAFVALLSFSAMFATILALAIGPLQKELDNHLAYSRNITGQYESRINHLEVSAAVSGESRRWLERMTDRNNDQIDMIWIEMKEHHPPSEGSP